MKKNTKTVYKVVYRRNKKLYSYVKQFAVKNKPSAAIRYTIGHTIKPKFGKLFVFKSFTSAKEYSQRILPTFSILQCEAVNCKPFERQNIPFGDDTKDQFIYFWESNVAAGIWGNLNYTPSETLVCDSLKVIKKVE